MIASLTTQDITNKFSGCRYNCDQEKSTILNITTQPKSWWQTNF